MEGMFQWELAVGLPRGPGGNSMNFGSADSPMQSSHSDAPFLSPRGPNSSSSYQESALSNPDSE